MIRSLRLLGVLCLMSFVLLPLWLHAQAPNWWDEQGVIDSSMQANDYAALNQGQLKNLAQAAAAELNAHLPGGAGANVQQLIADWNTPAAATNDYAAVNLGQLKQVAKRIYDPLIAIGYTSAYPWANAAHPPNDYALANIGQAKSLFSFDLLKVDPADPNGLPDWWEHYYFPGQTNINPNALAGRGDGLTIKQAFDRGLNPNDFFNGHTPVLAKLSVDPQTASPGRYLPAPLVVGVTDASGLLIANAPVVFTVSNGAGKLQASSSAAQATVLSTRTDANGQAQAFFQLPDVANVTNLITATVTGNNQTLQLTFTALTNDGTGTSTISPFAPTNMVIVMNPDGSAEMSWENHTDDQTEIDIYVEQRDGSVVVVDTIRAGSTSYHLPPQP